MMQNRLLTLIMSALLILGLTSCGGSEQEETKNVRFVKTFKVLPNTQSESYVFNGVAKEFREVKIAFRVGGIVEKVNVTDGQFVEKDQVVAEIDQRDYLVKYNAAKAAFKQSKSEYERYKELYERKKLPKNTLEKLEAGYLVAKSNLEQIQNALTDTQLKAPFSGYVHKVKVEESETVAPGMPIFTLIDLNKIEVVVNVPETHVVDVYKVETVKCKINNAGLSNIPAKIKSISKKGGAAHLYEVTLLLDGDAAKNVKPGMVAKVTMSKPFAKDSRILIPVESVFSKSKSKYVWVLNPIFNKVQKKQIEVGELSVNGTIEVQEGLKVGDVIVTAGVHSLLEDQLVKPLANIDNSNIGEVL